MGTKFPKVLYKCYTGSYTMYIRSTQMLYVCHTLCHTKLYKSYTLPPAASPFEKGLDSQTLFLLSPRSKQEPPHKGGSSATKRVPWPSIKPQAVVFASQISTARYGGLIPCPLLTHRELPHTTNLVPKMVQIPIDKNKKLLSITPSGSFYPLISERYSSNSRLDFVQ